MKNFYLFWFLFFFQYYLCTLEINTIDYEDKDNQSSFDIGNLGISYTDIILDMWNKKETNVEDLTDLSFESINREKTIIENVVNMDEIESNLGEFVELISATMKENFGEDPVELEGAQRIRKVAEIFIENFREFILCDKWQLEKIIEIPKNEKIHEILQETKTILNSQNINALTTAEKEELKNKEKELFKFISKYYSEIVKKKHNVDVYVQACVGLIWTKSTNPGKNGWFEKHCDLPHRHYLRKKSIFKCIGIEVLPNVKAIFLASFSILIQIIAPLYMIVNALGMDQNTLEVGCGEMAWNNICPNNIFSWDEEVDYSVVDIFTKLIAALLIYNLNGRLRKNAVEEWKDMIQNWSVYALPISGLIFSRIVHAIVYISILLATGVLFIGENEITFIILNFLKVLFLVEFHKLTPVLHYVTKGIASSNDDGRKLFLSYLASGCRKSPECLSRHGTEGPCINFLGYIANMIMVFGFIWIFTCV